MAVNRAGICLEVFQHQASPWHFTIFELKILQASNIFCPLEMPRLFWPSGFSGRNFHAFCPRVCLLRARVPSFGSSETTQIAGVLLMTRLGWTCIFSTLATGCLMSNLFDLSVLVSRSTQGVPDLHFSFTRKKKWVVTPCKKIGLKLFMVSYDFGFPLPKRETSHGHHSLLWLLWATAVVPSAGPKCGLKWASGVHPQ